MTNKKFNGQELGSKEGQALRYNKNKVQMERLPLRELAEVAKVFQASAEKYPDQEGKVFQKENWRKLWGDKTYDIAIGCMLRHLDRIQQGEVIDNESKGLHAAHIICNAIFIIAHELNQQEGDNLWT